MRSIEYKTETFRSMYCCGCGKDVPARLTSGKEIYPHREDLSSIPFWRCDDCDNYVGCHHKTDKPTRPLGCIPTAEIRNARKHIHAILDPIWKSKKMTRKDVYKWMNKYLGYEFHSAEIKDIKEARMIYKAIQKLRG